MSASRSLTSALQLAALLLLPRSATADLTVGSNTSATSQTTSQDYMHVEANGLVPPNHTETAVSSHAHAHSYGFWTPGSAQVGAILGLHADEQAGPYADGNSRITEQSYDVVFTSQDPLATHAQVAMHIHVRWSVSLPQINCGDLGDCNAYFFVGMGPTNITGSMGSLGCGGALCSLPGTGEADFVTPAADVQLNNPYGLTFDIQSSGRVGLCAADFSSSSLATLSVSLPRGEGEGGDLVFDLPPGVTANSIDYGIVDNHWMGATGCASLLQGPSDLSVAEGSPATLSATGSGADTLHWQWYRNGVPLSDGGTLSGATTSTLSISAAAAPDSGLYTVSLDNGCTPDTSAGARLSVTSTAAVASDALAAGRPRLTGFGAQPARGAMNFVLQMPRPGRAMLELCNIEGHLVARVPERYVPAGASHLTWDARGASGEPAPSGVYIVRLIVDGRRMDAHKVMLLR